jgi:hypothetical protein
MPPHQSRSNSITSSEGQQNGADGAPPLRLLLRGRAGLCLVLLWSLRGLCGGRFPANVPPSPQRPSEAKAWPHPSALPPLALGKPASPRTVHWLAPCIARWFAQRRARRGNAYSVGCAGWFVFVRRGRLQRKCILFIAVTSRRRHEQNAPSPSRHRCRVRVVCVNKKPMPDKTPGTGFFIATHHP